MKVYSKLEQLRYLYAETKVKDSYKQQEHIKAYKIVFLI